MTHELTKRLATINKSRGATGAVHAGLPEDSTERKACPVHSGVMAYFPDALAEVARLSKVGNDKHNPGEPLHWAKEKSTDHDDCIARHQLDRAKGHVFIADYGSANIRTRAAVAWRALAALQIEIENEAKDGAK